MEGFFQLNDYLHYVKTKAYEKALNVATSNNNWVGRGYLIEWTIRNNYDDDPAIVLLLLDRGVSSFESVNSAIDTDKPKTLRLLLSKVAYKPTSWTLICAINDKRRCIAVILVESGMTLPKEGFTIRNAISHAKRATYALLKAYKLLGKDATRMIAKLVWGSRANINWEK